MATAGAYWALPNVIATGSLASYQYYVVKAGSTAATVKVATTKATDAILGILQNDPASGEAAEVAFMGVCLALAEASVGYGEKLTCSSTGRVKKAASDGDEVVGVALKASGAAGDLIPVMLFRSEAAA
jgi:hypothetical protein